MISAFRFKYLKKISTKKHNRLHKYKKKYIYLSKANKKLFRHTCFFTIFITRFNE